jgi:hypothetical protein
MGQARRVFLDAQINNGVGQTKQSPNQRGGVKAHLPVVFHHPHERDSVHYGTLVRLFRDAQVLFQLALGQVVQHTRVHQTRGETVGVLFLESRPKTFQSSTDRSKREMSSSMSRDHGRDFGFLLFKAQQLT